MSRTVKLGLFAVVALAQLAVPGWMIGQREIVLSRGTVYKFRTAPIDPYDAFRGRYVWLNYESTSAPYRGTGEIPYGRPIFVTVETGEDGFARLTGAYARPPEAGDYFPVENYWIEDSEIQVRLPFDRYYMNEKAAPAAEIAVREQSMQGNRNAYVTVRVYAGYAVLEELHVDEKPIREFLDTLPATND